MKRTAVLICAVAIVSAAFCDEPIDAKDLQQLRAQAGRDIVVEGIVTDVGTTKTNSMTFINMGLPKKQGFVAVIFQKNYGAFPEGFTAYKDQKLRVSGKLDLYRGDTPQIEVRSPDQVQILKAE